CPSAGNSGRSSASSNIGIVVLLKANTCHVAGPLASRGKGGRLSQAGNRDGIGGGARRRSNQPPAAAKFGDFTITGRFGNLCNLEGRFVLMRWFRSNRGSVAWLAFFALACQLLLSFGHVHVGKFSGGSAAWAAAENGDASANVPPSSPPKNPTRLAGDFCAICANLRLANAL